MANQEKLLVITGKNVSLFANPNFSDSRSSTNLSRINAAIRPRTTGAKCNTLLGQSSKKKKHHSSATTSRLLHQPRPNVLHSYLSYNDILQYMDYLKVQFNDFVKLHTLGLSHERRPIKAIEIHWNSESNLWAQAKENSVRSHLTYETDQSDMEVPDSTKGRNIVFIEGGTHAREWITVTVALHCIHQLTEKNGRNRELLRRLRFFIVPVVNPDGYEYSKSTNPRWRKNRRPHLEDGYVGTDCNRNFDFHWDQSDQSKSMVNKNTYPGDKPFSEPETKALAHMLHKLASKILLYLSLHSYAQCIMYPWGYTRDLPKNAKMLEGVAMAARNAIKSYSGRYYRVGSISHVSKRTISGSVVDYAYGVVKIPLALVMELPSNEYGFQPPCEKIGPLNNESWCGIQEMCKRASALKMDIDFVERGLKHKNENIQSSKDSDSEISINVVAKELPPSSITTSMSSNTQNETTKKVEFNIRKVHHSVSGGYFTPLIDP